MLETTFSKSALKVTPNSALASPIDAHFGPAWKAADALATISVFHWSVVVSPFVFLMPTVNSTVAAALL